MAEHKCNKEREIGMMVEKLKSLEKGQDRIEIKLDNFIESADKKYATKLELSNLYETIVSQGKDIKWNKEKIVSLIKDAGIIGGIIATISKLSGLW